MSRFARRRSSFGARRTPRKGAWNGFLLENQVFTPGVVNAFYLWDDTISQRLNVAGKAVHQTSHVWISPSQRSTVFETELFWYLYAFTTDVNGSVVAGQIFSPRGGQLVFEKALMHWDLFRTGGATGPALNSYGAGAYHTQVKAKRKFDDTDALMLVIESVNRPTANVDPINVTVAARTYCSW